VDESGIRRSVALDKILLSGDVFYLRIHETVGRLPMRTLTTALLALCVTGQALAAQEQRFAPVAFHVGIVPPMKSNIYVDDPLDVWFDREMSMYFGVSYYVIGSETFGIGTYAEFELIKTSYDDGSRTVGGLAFAGRHPAKGLGAQFGGYIGFGGMTIGDLDGQVLIDYGMFAGPVFPLTPTLDLSIQLVGHFNTGFGGEVPEGILEGTPRLRIQLIKRRQAQSGRAVSGP
jgi:hypothetical protein